MTIQIRLASEADVPALNEFIPLSARGLCVDFYTPQQIESAIAHVFGVDSQLIADRTYFLAEDVISGTLVGCGGWSKRRALFGGDQFKKDRADPLLDPRGDAARIRAFFVHPNWGRRGIGRELMCACEIAVADAGFTRIEMGATLPGVPLYLASGYYEMEKFDLRLVDGVLLPLVRMVKTLAPNATHVDVNVHGGSVNR